MTVVPIESVIDLLTDGYEHLEKKVSWGETGIFYNPGQVMPRGKYVITFKEKDGENDCSSELNRDNVLYRLNFKMSKSTFLNYFNEHELPKRPEKGAIISLTSGRNYDPTVLNRIIPHPIYSWISWACVLNPSLETIESIRDTGLFHEAYTHAAKSYQPKTR